MSYMIEITESKAEKLSEHIEQGLRHMGKAMQCVEEMMEGHEMGERRTSPEYGYRSYYGNRYSSYGNRGSMGYRDDEDWEDGEMHERRGRRRRDSMGRYM